MKTLADAAHALAAGLDTIRGEFRVAGAFPPEVMAAAEAAARRQPTAHADRTGMPFVTLDPLGATDLDQAFHIEEAGADLLLHYAIADVAWFVDDGDPLDVEAWRRGATQYLPADKARLYPAILSEGAASLLPAGPRPAVIFTTRVAPDGRLTLDSVERAIIRNRAQLDYESVRDDQLPAHFAAIADRIRMGEDKRGAAPADPPEQEVYSLPDGGLDLRFRPRSLAEDRNATLSLATNIAVADLLLRHETGLFRVMGEPDARAIERLRLTARAFGLVWPEAEPLAQFERALSAANPAEAAFMLAIRRAGRGARYMPYEPGRVPWHAAVGATYAHATAPLRRLADRYVIRAALALAAGQPVPGAVAEAFTRLPAVMARAEALEGQIQRAVLDLAEALILEDDAGVVFPAIVTDVDERGARIQLRDMPVVERMKADGLRPGDALDVRLLSADIARRKVVFEPA